MISTTVVSRRRGAFSLVEVMVVIGISGLILTAVMTSLLLVGRNSLSTSDYVDFDDEARRGLELFAREVRMAEDVSNFSTSGVTLRVRDTESTTYNVTYSYIAQNRAFYRAYGTADQRLLIRDIASFEMKRYNLTRGPATNDLETKQLQLQLRSVRSGGARALASNNVVSARYILRNKIVSN